MTNKHVDFESIFFPDGEAVSLFVPDYQRAFAWELDQIDLFIKDLVKYQGSKQAYYFGHFIMESSDGSWQIVDGQQRITTWILFLFVASAHKPATRDTLAYALVKKFSTVSYDNSALSTFNQNLETILNANSDFIPKKPTNDEKLISGLALTAPFTRSQRRMLLAILRFDFAFRTGELSATQVQDYIAAIMSAHCSQHKAWDKSVAVNIFEMHNTRGVPLTTLERIKAKLIKFVYDHSEEDRSEKVGLIQAEFGGIYGFEERLATSSFRGEMSMDQLLRLHLRVIDDGSKREARELQSPATNATAEDLINYIESRLHFFDNERTKQKSPQEGLKYALNLVREFRKSMSILCELLPNWDNRDPLVGDVLILEREISTQFLLIICRKFESSKDASNGIIKTETLRNWERLLFTRDLHDAYHRKTYKDNFPELFAACLNQKSDVDVVVDKYLKDGFRSWDSTKDLQGIVCNYLKDNKPNILNNAYYWWKAKMCYALYKYEASNGANIREVMKGTISVEHILPQEWQWNWLDGVEHQNDLPEDQREQHLKETGSYINGIGNLLLLTPGANTSLGNKHPSEKDYSKFCTGGIYTEHANTRDQWSSSCRWKEIIHNRGEQIFNFIMRDLAGKSSPPSNP